MTIELTSTTHCPDCGSILPTGPLAGLCPQCLLDSTLASEPSRPDTSTKPTQIPFVPSLPCRFAQYQLLEIVGRGAAGTVFRARDESLNREVAIKALHAGPLASRESIRRFFNEARVAARLSHPHIAPVYEVAGGDQVQPFVVMPFLPGGNLADQLKKHHVHHEEPPSSKALSNASAPTKPTPPLINTQRHSDALRITSPENPFVAPPARSFNSFRQIAQLLQKIASAVKHAHQHGVLHRDLKPANILFDSVGEPYVADFGLARVLEEESTLTLDNTVLGTPAYMSPEQATGSGEFSVASDIYSLGAILYELLTGRPPFVAPTIAATLRAIIEQTPAPMVGTRSTGSQISSSRVPIPSDLETICLKCLEKDPAKRYSTAQSLADDLQHFLNNEPISARPITRTAKLVRWSQRNPAVATAYSLLFLVLLLLLFGSPVAIYRINEARKSEAFQRALVEAAARQEVILRQLSQSQAYTADMNLAYHEWEQGNLLRAQALLRSHIPLAGGRDLRGFEWRYLFRLCRDVSLALTNLDEPVWRLATNPDGQFIAAACDKDVRLFDSANGREIERLPFPNLVPKNTWHLIALASRATNLLAAHRAEGVICISDVALGKTITSFRPFTNNAGALALSPDGKLLAAADRKDFYGTQVGIWNIASNPRNPRIVWTNSVEEGIPAIVFSPDGTKLLLAKTSMKERMLEIRDAATGILLQAIKDGAPGYIETVAFSPDGTLIAYSGAEGRIRVWDLGKDQFKNVLDGHAGGVSSLAFSPDGRRLLSSGSDRSIRQWDVATGQLSGVWRETGNGPISAVFASDGHSIISATENRLKRWRAEPQQIAKTLEVPAGFTWPAISPDGRWLAISGLTSAESAIVLDLRTRKKQLTLSFRGALPQTPAFSPDGRLFALGDISKEGLVGIWDTSLWLQPARTVSPMVYITNSFEAGSVSFSPDGRILVVAGLWFPPFAPKEPSHATNRLSFWSVPDFKKLDLLSQAGIGESDWTAAATARFSRDGQSLAVGYRDGFIRLWEVKTGRLLHAWKEHESSGWGVDLRFSHDGRWMASVALGGSSVILFDLADLNHPRTVLVTRDDPAGPMWLDFAPDNKTLVTAHYDGMINFWNLETFQAALTLRHSSGPATVLAFSPDGSFLVSKDAQGLMKFWETAPESQITATPRKESNEM